MKRWLGVAAVLGGLVYAAAGGLMAAQNLGWFGLARNANDLFVWLGVGLALIVIPFAKYHGREIGRRRPLGRVAAIAAIAAPLILLLSMLVEFAILGTLATFVAILTFTITVHRGRFLPPVDVVLLYAATIASITWNTETPSAALLIVVGFVGSWVSYRVFLAGRWRTAA